MELIIRLFLSFMGSMATGALIMNLIIGLFCEGTQPNWLCSGHGGAAILFGFLTMIVTFPLYIYLTRKPDSTKVDNRK